MTYKEVDSVRNKRS